MYIYRSTFGVVAETWCLNQPLLPHYSRTSKGTCTRLLSCTIESRVRGKVGVRVQGKLSCTIESRVRGRVRVRVRVRVRTRAGPSKMLRSILSIIA